MKTILVDAVNTFVLKDEGIYKPLHDLLEEYPNQKIVLTSANDEQMETFGLTDLPYKLFTLKHDPEKTDKEYYLTMLKKFDLDPEDTVYFEHNPEAVETAKSVGIKSYHYDPKAKDIERLKAFLDDSLTQ